MCFLVSHLLFTYRKLCWCRGYNKELSFLQDPAKIWTVTLLIKFTITFSSTFGFFIITIIIIIGSKLSAEERFPLPRAELNHWQAKIAQQEQLLLTLWLPWVQMVGPQLAALETLTFYAAFTLSSGWLTSTCGIKAFSRIAPAPSAGCGVRRGDLMWGFTMTVLLDQHHGSTILTGNLKMRSAAVVN